MSAGSATNLANAITIISNSNSNSVSNNGTITAVNAAGFAVAAPTIGATSSPVTVLNNAGATINGNVDTAGGTFTNNGTWSTTFINNANVINNGTMIVGGNIQSQLNPVVLNGTLKTTGTVSTAADFTMQQATQLVVNGEATVSGKLHVTPYNIAPQAVAVLTSLKTLSLGSLSVTDDSNGLYTYKVAQVGNSLQITPQGNFSAIAKQDGLGRGAQSLAEHLETSFNASTPVLQGTFNYLAKVATTAGVKSTLDTLSNETVQSVGTSRLTASQAFVARMNSCPQFGDNGVELNERDCAWTRAVDNRVHRDDTNEAAGYSQQNHAMQFGGQKGIGGDWFLGASFAYDTSSTNGSNSNTAGNGWAAGLMLKRQLGEWLFSGSVDGGSGHYNTERQVMLGAVSADAKASFTGQNFGVHGRVARQFSMSNWYVKPYVDLHATRIQTGAYTETNGGAYDLAVNAQHDNLFAASTMVEVGSRFELRSNMALRTYVSGGMTDYSKNEWSADAKLAGASDATASFDSVSTLPKHRATIGAGVNLLVGDKVDVKLEYTGEMAAGYRSNTASAKVSYLF